MISNAHLINANPLIDCRISSKLLTPLPKNHDSTETKSLLKLIADGDFLMPDKSEGDIMQLISIGDVLLNLDQITVLDIDPTPTGPVVRVHRDSPQPIIEISIPPQTVNGLFNLVPTNQRMGGRD